MKVLSMTTRLAFARTLLRRRVHVPLVVSCLLFFTALSLPAQDGFTEQSGFDAQSLGFGFDDETAGGTFSGEGGSAPAVSIGGEVSVSMTGFVDDFSDGADNTRLGDIFSGTLNFTAETTYADGVINLKLAPALVYYDEKSPVYVDEAYIRAYFGKLDITGGLRKLTWGKADSMGPLDVVNPLDYSDLSDLSDMMNLKIARPLIHASFVLGQFSKLEGVFVPNFEPARFAASGRWAPAQMAELSRLPPENVIRPDTTTLDYAQAGLRFTTTIGAAADIGVQYYYGRLTTPAVTMTAATLPVVTFAYNPYHQIGLDYAQVIAGFNLRAEAAANITGDLSGDDGAVYNPSLAWSLGFDRDLFAGINLNLQCNETIRLLDGEIKNPQDIEADSDITTTNITAALSKKFLRDELEMKAAVMWEAEGGACLVMPSLIWTRNDVAVEFSAGIFAGSGEGLFGQFHENSFVKAALTYSF
ncbi:MAG: hypothetical protein LBK83_11060 [Treponema sp.]|jgi:hypothetical protein|nr:hypothetical protein [Treponema sp.]